MVAIQLAAIVVVAVLVIATTRRWPTLWLGYGAFLLAVSVQAAAAGDTLGAFAASWGAACGVFNAYTTKKHT